MVCSPRCLSYSGDQKHDLPLQMPDWTQQPIGSSFGMQTFALQDLKLQGQASAVLTAKLESVEKYGVACGPLGTTVPNAIATKPTIRRIRREVQRVLVMGSLLCGRLCSLPGPHGRARPGVGGTTDINARTNDPRPGAGPWGVAARTRSCSSARAYDIPCRRAPGPLAGCSICWAMPRGRLRGRGTPRTARFQRGVPLGRCCTRISSRTRPRGTKRTPAD